MNAFAAVVLALAVASASAGYSGDYHHVASKPSGFVSVNHDGALIAGPSGSVHTNNGLHGHGAGVKLSGPSGNVKTQGGHAYISGPGHDSYEHESYSAPVVYNYGAYGSQQGAFGAQQAAYGAHHGAVVAGPSVHATVVGPTSHATLVAPVAYQTWGHQASAYGHHGW